MSGETRKLGFDPSVSNPAKSEIKPIDLGLTRPWRIALRIVQLQMEIIVDLAGSMVIGRAHPESNFYPDVDLSPFNGGNLGVSREHVFIKLDGERVVVVDNKSANGTKLNGEYLKANEVYPIRHGDELTLGLMKLQIEFLTDPFN